ncbi:hypothetical protein [Paenibacillus vandeheii]
MSEKASLPPTEASNKTTESCLWQKSHCFAEGDWRQSGISGAWVPARSDETT